MLCKCYWIVLSTVYFTAFSIGGSFFSGHDVYSCNAIQRLCLQLQQVLSEFPPDSHYKSLNLIKPVRVTVTCRQ